MTGGESLFPRETCYICGSEDDIESHHRLPDRYGGSDAASNLVDLCHDCHWKLERIYNNEFFEDRLNLSRGGPDAIWGHEDARAFEVPFETMVCVLCERSGPFSDVTLQPNGIEGYQCERCDTIHVINDGLREDEIIELETGGDR